MVQVRLKSPLGLKPPFIHRRIAALKRCATQKQRRGLKPIIFGLLRGPEGPIFHVTAHCGYRASNPQVLTLHADC
jgi:hypothetical protein